MTLANWIYGVEQIVLACTKENGRTVGLTSLHSGAGVSLLCRHIAGTFASGEAKTLLIATREAAEGHRGWVPGQGKASHWIEHSTRGYDFLEICTDETSRALLSNPTKLTEAMCSEFGDFDRIVVDLPPLLENSVTSVNPFAVARSCDQLLLVCALGRDRRREIAQAKSRLKASGIALTGVVANAHLHTDALDKMADLLHRVAQRF